MVTIETLRMVLRPLTIDEMLMASRSPQNVGKIIGAFQGRMDSADLKLKRKVYAVKHEIMEECPERWLYCTSWQMVMKLSGWLAGDLGFKGGPEGGELEVGYGAYPDFRGRGLMPEALNALCHFAFSRAGGELARVTALTLKDNYSSHRVLQKCGFCRDGKRGRLLLWEKRRDGQRF